MPNNLFPGSLRTGTAAQRPTGPDITAETFGFYYETDTGLLNIAPAGAVAWQQVSATRPQPTPAAKVANANLTIAELQTRIITATSASAVALTLPTGTLTDAGIASGSLRNDQSIDWEVINLGNASGAVTMTADTGHTYVGNAVVAISTSAQFRTRKTAANTFVTYRVS